MKGHVYKRGTTWSYVADIGIIDGKRKQKSKGGYNYKRDAEKALSDLLSELQTSGIIFEIRKMTFQELFEDFLKYECEPLKKPTTIVKYKSIFNNHWKSLLGHKFIANITADDINDYILEIAKTHSPAYIKSMVNGLVAIFNYAIKKNYIKESPMRGVTPPRLPRSDITLYSKTEISMIYKRLETTNLQSAFFIGLNTGMRAGECYGLTWKDIDFDKMTITINKQLQSVVGIWSFVETKTDSSDRVIDMNRALANYLLNVKSVQEENKKVLGTYYKTNLIQDIRDHKAVPIYPDFVNTKPDGEMLNTNSHKVISRLAKSEFGLEFIFHNLRHTHVSMLLEQGYSINYIQQRLGHAKPSITWDTYSHLLPDKSITLDKFDNALDYLLT